ncbi:MAG: FAD-dependent oxidoreductase, partial [Holosporaceae bacterium]|nr:FAD-dependent oxidoreductase [Holosporaceae bacterium]
MTEVLILGSGPAGYTAAIYAARAGRSTKLIAGPRIGGQLITTMIVENYPGFIKPISGPALIDNIRQQAEKTGIESVFDTVKSVDFSGKRLVCIGESGTVYDGKTVIIATGATTKWLEIPGEFEYRGSGVSSCATCDGIFFKNKTIAVVGGGNTAVCNAIYLSNFAKSVTLIHRRDKLRAEKVMQDSLMKNPKINVIWNTTITDILGDGKKLTELLLLDVINKAQSAMAVDGLFVSIGHEPATEIFGSQLELDEDDYIVTEPGST